MTPVGLKVAIRLLAFMHDEYPHLPDDEAMVAFLAACSIFGYRMQLTPDQLGSALARMSDRVPALMEAVGKLPAKDIQ